MAPTSSLALVSRYYNNNNCQYVDEFGNCVGRTSTWYNWGRWVALVVVVLFFLLLAFAFSCFNARRRRRRGMAPRYGTGWLGGKYAGNNAQQNYGGQQQYGAPAPPYEAPNQHHQNTGNTFNSNEGYYGQQSGIELQQPQNSYQPQREAANVYSAPQGPPPGKGGYGNDGIIR